MFSTILPSQHVNGNVCSPPHLCDKWQIDSRVPINRFPLSIVCVSGQLKSEKYQEVQNQLNLLMVIVRKFEELKLDTVEFGYLRLIVFTATGKWSLGPIT